MPGGPGVKRTRPSEKSCVQIPLKHLADVFNLAAPSLVSSTETKMSLSLYNFIHSFDISVSVLIIINTEIYSMQLLHYIFMNGILH